jgi:hypothetical protein
MFTYRFNSHKGTAGSRERRRRSMVVVEEPFGVVDLSNVVDLCSAFSEIAEFG